MAAQRVAAEVAKTVEVVAVVPEEAAAREESAEAAYLAGMVAVVMVAEKLVEQTAVVAVVVRVASEVGMYSTGQNLPKEASP